MINVAKVTTVPKMSSESRTSGDGEAKEIEQDQTTTVSGESGSSVSEGRTSDADVKAEKAVSKENETLETSKPSEEHSVLQSRSSTDERDLNAPHTEGEATPVEKKESDEPSRIVDHTKDSTRDKEVTPPDKSAENTKEVSLSSESEHVDNRKVEPGLTADPETERQDDAHTEGTDPSDVVVDDNKPPESSNDGTATGGVGSSVPNSEQPEELQSPHIDDPSSSAGTQEGSSVSHQDVGKDSPERKKEQLLQEETATEVASEQAQATVDSSAVPGVPTASKQDKEDLQMERDSKAAKQEMTADTNDTTSDDFTEAKPKDETEEPGKGEKRDGEDPAKGKLQPDDEPPPTDGQKSSSEGVVGDKEEKLNEGAPKDGEEPTVNKTSKEEDNSSSQESTKAASKDSDPGKGDHTDTPVQEESPPSVKQETTAPVQTTEKTITEPATDAHKTETSTKVTSEGQDNKGETTDTPEEERILPDDFFYDYEKLRSKPESVDVSMDILKLHHSFGFECQKRSNLIALDKDVIAFAAGNFVNIINLETGEHTYLRSLSGGGIGAIAVHPSSEYFAVGEKGTHPHIAIYTYPDLKLHRLLREGTEEMYSHMAFSPKDGALLASVGGNPDYMLTVWDWKKESIVLRSKAFSQDIYRVSFSPDLEGQLTTSGTGHIRFWKMARTFTGLKLQGQLGKFGRTELTDIAAYVELPDGKVLSGTEWGNLLLWDGGFIKVEIAKKGKKTCHNGTIEAMFLEEGELITAGADGYVKVWDYETIDNADITEDNTQFEMEPLTEIRVGTKVSIKSLVRCADPEMTTMWYAQDANGVIWNVDVIDSHMRKPPEKLLHFPSGAITGLGVSSKDYLTGVLAEDGSVTVFNYSTKERVCMSKFTGGGGALLWAPDQIDAESKTLVAGFGDGVVRVLVMEESDPRQVSAGRRLSPKLVLAHVCKPHTKTVTAFAVDPSGDLLATGSEDSTVFFLSMKEAYDPIGFIQTPSPVTSMMWSHHDNQDELKLLVCCEDGSMIEVDAPKKGVFDTSRTYFLDPLKFSCRTFQTVKDKIKKAEEDARIAAEKEKKRKEREERLAKKREEEGEEAELSDEEEEEPEPEEVHEEEEEKQKGPSPILKGFYYGPDRDFWLSMVSNCWFVCV
jgi:WD40 repeat protein